MPIYEYTCKCCGQVSESFVQGFNSIENPVCPRCGSHAVERLPSTPTLLKGRTNPSDSTCCGRTERCETPPCSAGERCRRT